MSDGTVKLTTLMEGSARWQILAAVAMATGKVPRHEVIRTLNSALASNKHEIVSGLNRVYSFEPEELVPVLGQVDLSRGVPIDRQYAMLGLNYKLLINYMQILTEPPQPDSSQPANNIDRICECEPLSAYEMRYLCGWISKLNVQLNGVAVRWMIANIINHKGDSTKESIYRSLMMSRHAEYAKFVNVDTTPATAQPAAAQPATPVVTPAAQPAAAQPAAQPGAQKHRSAFVPIIRSGKLATPKVINHNNESNGKRVRIE